MDINIRLLILAVLGLILIAQEENLIDAEYTTSSSEDYEDYLDSSIDLTRTYISGVEKILISLSIPLKIVNETAQGIQQGISKIVGQLPSFVQKGLSFAGNEGSKTFGDILNTFSDKFQAIYPGTLWCGGGDVAKSDDDLGFFNNTDACCRQHDHCPISIAAQQQRDGLLNNGIFTRSHCSCDEEFYKCLHDANNIIATKIGITYFNILRPQCFKKDYPIVRCKKKDRLRIIDKKCTDYVQDRHKEPKEQWFDNPDF